MLGEDPQRARRAWRERIGIVLQSCRLDPYLTVRESLELYAGYYAARARSTRWSSWSASARRRDARTGKLSGGQQRRLDVGMALVGDPELLFLDEPTTGFDPQARRQAWEAIAGLRQLGKTVFLTTHYMDEAQRLGRPRRDHRRRPDRRPGTPEELGDRDSQPTTISYRGPDGEVSLATTTPAQTLNELTGPGAGARASSSQNLEVRRPTLEDVYLELTERGDRPHEPRPAPVPLRPEGLLAQPGVGLLHRHVPGRLPLILAIVFGGETVTCAAGSTSTTYYVPAIMTLSVISATMQSLAMSLVIAREDGPAEARPRHADAGLGLHRRPHRQLDRGGAADARRCSAAIGRVLYGVRSPGTRCRRFWSRWSSAPPPSAAWASR